ncbi:MAG: PilZ domain-containing protein [Methylobacter sp.]|jgi:hypothetical protein
MERRLYYRVPLQASAVVTNKDGISIEVLAIDISNDGLGIQCDINQRNLITPGGSFVRDGRPVEVVVHLDLLGESGEVSKIVVRCQVKFSRRISSDECKIGVRYIEFEGDGYNRIVQFVEKSLASIPLADRVLSI